MTQRLVTVLRKNDDELADDRTECGMAKILKLVMMMTMIFSKTTRMQLTMMQII